VSPGPHLIAFAENRSAGTALSHSPRGDRRIDLSTLVLRPSISPDGRPEDVLGDDAVEPPCRCTTNVSTDPPRSNREALAAPGFRDRRS
jgi:hypothetical protein